MTIPAIIKNPDSREYCMTLPKRHRNQLNDSLGSVHLLDGENHRQHRVTSDDSQLDERLEVTRTDSNSQLVDADDLDLSTKNVGSHLEQIIPLEVHEFNCGSLEKSTIDSNYNTLMDQSSMLIDFKVGNVPELMHIREEYDTGSACALPALKKVATPM